MDNETHETIIRNANKEEQLIRQQAMLSDWQQLSPVAILYFAASSFKHLFNNVFVLIPALIFSYKSILQHPFIWLPGIAAALGLLAFFAFLSFRVYRYRLTENNVEIRSGVISKKHLNLPFERVQNVKIEQPLYYRITGHACLQLDTAGSAKSEAKIIALGMDFAEQLKAQILSHNKLNSHQSSDSEAYQGIPERHAETVKTPNEIVLNRRSLSDLIIHGVTSNRIWIFLGGMAPFFDNIVDALSGGLSGLGIELNELFSLETHSMLEVGIYALSLTMLIMLVLVSFSVLGAIISFYGYTLSKLGDRYIRRSGLLTKHEVSMRLSRLQMVIRKQDWLDVVLKRINLNFEQNSSFDKNMDPSATSNKIMVPSVTPYECQDLINDAYPDNTLESLISDKGFTAISKRFILRNIGFILLPMWLVISGFAIESQQYLFAALATGIFILLCGLVVLRWKRWGIARDQYFIYLRKGLIGTDYYCFPAYKVQQTQFIQNLLMQRRGLASVKFVLASGTVKVPLIAETLAYYLADDCLYQVESSQKSWM